MFVQTWQHIIINARVEHKGHISRGKDRQAFPNEPLNEIYNKIRAEARKQIRKNSEATF